MIIGGLQKFTLIDFPGKIAATVFLSGCNFRCPWCYSKELVLPDEIKNHPKISEADLFEFLKLRQETLEGVVVCGGEPTMNKELPDFIRRIKELGYGVKLDTNGSNPEMLKSLLEQNLVDYVAMDIKAPKEKYEKLAGKKVSVKNIEKSVSTLLTLSLSDKKIGYEFRTTVIPRLLKKEDVIKIARWISGAEKYYLQNFRPEKNNDPRFEKIKPYSDKDMADILKAVSPFFGVCQIR